MLRDHGMARLKNWEGRNIYTTSGMPLRRGWFRMKWPPVVRYVEVWYYDAGYTEGDFRIYQEVPTLKGWD